MVQVFDKRFVAMLAAGMLSTGIASVPAAHARNMTVVGWGAPPQPVQDTVYFQPFQKQTGIKFDQASWDGGIGIIRAKVQSGYADWDLIEVELDELALGCEEGLYEKLDWSKLGGKDIYYPQAVSTCGDGTFFYNFVMAWDASKLKDGPKSWADFFDLKTYPGKRALRSGPKTNLEIALMGDGVAPKDVYKMLATPEGVDRAFKKLDTIKPEIVWWQTGRQPIELLHSGQVVMTAVYSGTLITAKKKGHENFGFLWDESLSNMDSWVILKGSPFVAQAEQLLDFMSDPHRQAEVPKLLPSGPTNKETIKYVDQDLVPELPTAPQNSKNLLPIDVAFWLENYDKLNDRYFKWAAQ